MQWQHLLKLIDVGHQSKEVIKLHPGIRNSCILLLTAALILCLHALIWPLYALTIPILILGVRYSVIGLFNSPKFPDQLRVNNQSAPESDVVLLPGIYLSSHKLFSILHRLTAIRLRLRIQDLGTPCMLISWTHKVKDNPKMTMALVELS